MYVHIHTQAMLNIESGFAVKHFVISQSCLQEKKKIALSAMDVITAF